MTEEDKVWLEQHGFEFQETTWGRSYYVRNTTIATIPEFPDALFWIRVCIDNKTNCAYVTIDAGDLHYVALAEANAETAVRKALENIRCFTGNVKTRSEQLLQEMGQDEVKDADVLQN